MLNTTPLEMSLYIQYAIFSNPMKPKVENDENHQRVYSVSAVWHTSVELWAFGEFEVMFVFDFQPRRE